MSSTVQCTVCGSMTLPCRCGTYVQPDEHGNYSRASRRFQEVYLKAAKSEGESGEMSPADALQKILDALEIDDLNINSRGLFEGYISRATKQESDCQPIKQLGCGHCACYRCESLKEERDEY